MSSPNGKYGVRPGALGRSEFGLEIIPAMAQRKETLDLRNRSSLAGARLRLSFRSLMGLDDPDEQIVLAKIATAQPERPR